MVLKSICQVGKLRPGRLQGAYRMGMGVRRVKSPNVVILPSSFWFVPAMGLSLKAQKDMPGFLNKKETLKGGSEIATTAEDSG